MVLLFSLVFAAVLSAQTELHTLTASEFNRPKTDTKMPAGEYTCGLSLRDDYLLVWSSCGYLLDWAAEVLLLATWAIALPFTQRKVSCMMFELQRGCPGVRTACHAL